MGPDFESPGGGATNGGASGRKSFERQMIGQFRVEKILGAGGMSVVYKCTDLVVNRPVAVKVLQKHLAFEERWVMRFRHEAVAIGRLSHPNIVRVHHFDAQEDEPFIVMDFVDGIALSDSLSFGGALSVARSVKLICEAMDALAHAHANGVVHRDLKPSNIMIVNANTPEESVRILDFGIAKIAEEESNYKLTQTGEVLGSPLYMSPEQCAGRPAFERSDQYSIGCVLFECLTGHPPFVGDSSINIIVQHMNEVPPTLKQASLGKSFSPELEAVVKRLLQKNPEHRFASMAEAKAALEATLSKEIKSTSVLKLNLNDEKRRSGLIVAATVFGGVLSLAAGGVFVQSMLGGEHLEDKPVEQVSIVSTKMEGEFGDKGLADYLQHDEHRRLDTSFDAGAHGFKIMTDKGLAMIAKMPNLGELKLTNCGEITADGFKSLWDTPRLENLDVSGIMMSDEHLRNIARINNLSRLNLNGTRVHASSLAELADTKLRVLSVCNDDINEDGCLAISKINSLQELNIAQNQRAGRGLKDIVTMPNLDTLKAGDTHLNDEDLLEWSNVINMRNLDVSHNFIGDNAIPKILRMQHLERLNVSDTEITDAGLMQLVELKDLQHVNVRGCKVSKQAVSDFREQVKDRATECTIEFGGYKRRKS